MLDTQSTHETYDPRNDLGEIEVDWKNPPSLMDLKADFSEAEPFAHEQRCKIDTWLDNLYINGKAKQKKRKGRSSVVPKLIRKQAEWRYAALTEPFLDTEEMFSTSPRTFEDTKASEQNQLLLNYQFSVDIDKRAFFDELIRTVVDEGTGIVQIGWEYEEEEIVETVPEFKLVEDPLFSEALNELALIKDSDPNSFDLDYPYELKEALRISLEEGIAYRPELTGKEKQVTSIKVLENRPTLQICDYRNISVDPTCEGDISKANFITYSYEMNKAEMIKDGRFFNLDRLGTNEGGILAEPDHSPSTENSEFVFKDDARKQYVVREYWGFRDVEGNGKLTSIVAAWVGNTLVMLRENPYPSKELPFEFIQYMPVRKSLYGEPDGELLEENQKVIGAVTRGMIDVMGRSANGQTGVAKNWLDVTNRRKYEQGFDYEFNPNVDPRVAIYHHVFPEIPASAQFLVQQQNQEAESLTGVKAFNGGLSGDTYGDTAIGTRSVLDSASKREMGILRRIGSGVISIGKKITQMNAEFLSDEEVIRVTNDEFVKVRRNELAGKFDLKLSISTAEEEDAKAKDLSFLLQTLGNTVDQGITTLILSRIAKTRKMPDLSKQLEESKPEPDPVQQEIQQLEITKLKAEIAEIQSRTQENIAEAKLDNAKSVTEGAKADLMNSQTDQAALNFVEQESGVTQERDLQKQGEQARANMELKSHEANIENNKNIKDKASEIESNALREYLSNEEDTLNNNNNNNN